MDQLISGIFRTHQTGLQLLTMPTGSGKTYSMNRAIFEYITDDSIPLEEKRNMVVVTTMKKNLDCDGLRSMFEASGKLALFEEVFIFLNSLSEIVVEYYEESMEDQIFAAMGRDKIATDFITSLTGIKESMRRDPDSPTVKLAIESFAANIEPRFRRKLRAIIRKEKFTYDNRLKLIETTKKWGWVAKLYPSIYSRRKKIFFMSADKFVMRNDTIIDKSNTIYDSPIVKNAIIFIDEFDSTKNQILNRLITNNTRRKIDYVDMAQKIYAGIHDENIPSMMFRINDNFKGDLKEAHKSLEKQFKKTINKYHLDKLIKLSKDCQSERAFIFRGDTVYMVNGTNDSISLAYQKDENRNILRFFNGKAKENRKLFYIIEDIGKCIDHFCSFVSMMALNYQKNNDDATMSYEDCILTVLDTYGISDSMPSYRSYLLEKILLGTSSSDNKIIGVDQSVYENGFEYYILRDDTSNNERTIIELISYPVSAEKILLKVCEQALVFGMSATAGLKSVIGNYDLDYLAARLEDRYLPLADNDERMIRQILTSRENFERKIIRTQAVVSKDAGEYNDGFWKEIIGENLDVVMEKIDMSDDVYDKERYYQISRVFYDFVRDRRARAGLCFCNKHPVSGDSHFDRDILRLIFSVIIAENEGYVSDDFTYSDSVFFLRGDGFDKNKEHISEYLASGKKGFVITVYNTVGAGQNLQFDIPEGFKAVNISGRSDGIQMDFDFLYLQKPTFLIGMPEYPEQEETKARVIAQLNYLLQNGEITEKETKEGIAGVLSFDMDEMTCIAGIARQTHSVKRYGAARLIQAVGRICRTPMKNEQIVIEYDEGLGEYLEEPLRNYGNVNVETEELIKAVSVELEPTKEERDYVNMGIHRSHNARKVIDKLKANWTDKHIQDYTKMRNDVLCHPSTDILGNTAYQMYMEAPFPTDHYLCKYSGEFQNLQISFSGRLPGGHPVSTESLRLPDLMKIDGLEEHFRENGYATKIEPARYIITPVAAKNFLMGILGEVAGKYILEKYGIHLQDLERKYFERFDFQINKDVAIDFKHWASEKFTSKEEQITKISRKMDDTGHSVVYVINILLPEGKSRQPIVTTNGHKKIITVPWLFDPKTGDYNTEIISELKGYE
ncbi:hypothetical protein [Candidatus Methanarcanum hacksteinii]|uniref:hypothetical protein n=1 Tax=Candidatus Methanarcanum hacksteinii TaxID=2911857 RepID=UPI0037DCDAAF